MSNNLKKEIIKDIYSNFPEINWKWLNHTSYPRIRFYFDENESNLSDLWINLQKIFKNLFLDDEIFIWLILFWNKTLPHTTIKSLKDRKLFQLIEKSEENMILKNSVNNYFYYFSKIDFNELKDINKAIIEKDFAIPPQLNLDCFYFNFNKWIVINLYDDRGMDIISQVNNKNHLQKIYDTFHNDYKIIFEQN